MRSYWNNLSLFAWFSHGQSGSKTISSLYSQNPSESCANVEGDVVLATRAKATALLNRAASLSQGLGHSGKSVVASSLSVMLIVPPVFDPTSPAFVQSFNAVDNALNSFLASLPSLSCTSFSQTTINDNEMEDAFLYYSLRTPRRAPTVGTSHITTSSLQRQLSPLSRTGSILSQALASPASSMPQRTQTLPVLSSPSQNLAPPHAQSFLAHTLCLAHILSRGAIIRLHRPFAFPHPSKADSSGRVRVSMLGDGDAGLGSGWSGRRLGPRRHVESVLKAARDMANVVHLVEAQEIEPRVMCVSLGVSHESESDPCNWNADCFGP